MNAFCASVKLLAFIRFLSSPSQESVAENSSFKRSSFRGSDQNATAVAVLIITNTFRVCLSISTTPKSWATATHGIATLQGNANTALAANLNIYHLIKLKHQWRDRTHPTSTQDCSPSIYKV
ncbi:hypothetical protein EEB11_02640 [Pseudotabrizicola sediminis]|uniref:Secreted protein n=1 Tax=Pseudotabrizicola sediminis TaxID=2486418 RepID=A0ABY2KT91_9RHOB|nr:hypothetical protein EEB11_02640 [Pseudotabrizicola sediminis]